ncbi:SCO7613 C-terminal domain-containing membrane protein, partial [Nocardioides sp.]|uniref:SCO7613 C-terminal domain-containing membrane protein n=1 Tax=Nocardioides sp. TaxID=35761 RepID=UPI0035688EBD
LLTLGALCLLVAAVIFLAVAWSWLGVGGRTVVLVVLTAATGGAGVALGRRGLRLAAEALIAVALGLLVLDLVGADQADWFGDLRFEQLLRIIGGALVVAGGALCIPRDRLITPQLAVPGGLGLVLASIDWWAHRIGEVDLGGLTTVLVFAGVALLARHFSALVLAWVSGGIAGLAWAVTVMVSLVEALAHPSVEALWSDGHGWELTAATLLVLLAWPLAWSVILVRLGAGAVVAALGTLVLVLPALDGSPNQVTLVALGVVLVWAGVSAVTSPAWVLVPWAPLAGGALVAFISALVLLGHAALAVASAGDPFAETAGVRLDQSDLPLHPLLLLTTCAGLGVAAALALPVIRKRSAILAMGGAMVVASIATLALYPVPLWTVLAAGAAAVGVAWSFALTRTNGVAIAVVSALTGGLIVGAALPSAVLTTLALALLVGALTATLLRGRFTAAAELSGLALPIALAGLVWAAGEVADVSIAFRAAPILVLVGLLAILRPRLELEVTAAAAALAAALVAVPEATDVSVSAALHLTLAGALVTAHALIHPSRRRLSWVGGLLLAAATWVRLADVGVEQPEPYTLPSAVALVLVGLYRLRMSADVPTSTALLPGLALATVPSLLWVLEDPVSIRAVILGVACLALLLFGVTARWHAPVLVGAVVGGLVVVRELAPYAAQTPQWVLIGAAGAVLIGSGITWESRMRDLRNAAAYLGRLR